MFNKHVRKYFDTLEESKDWGHLQFLDLLLDVWVIFHHFQKEIKKKLSHKIIKLMSDEP